MRFLGLSKEEVAENERLWQEENDEQFGTPSQDPTAQMRDAGITGADISNDLASAEGEDAETEPQEPTGETSPLGGASTAAQPAPEI
jgi:hypothetical protein